MLSYVYTAVILNIISLASLVDTASTTSTICNLLDDVDSSKHEIKCYNYKNTLRFNVTLTKNIRTIKLIRNDINALDSSSFPNLSEAIERIFLNSNNLKELPPGVFKNFPNLKFLDLTDNNISEFHPDVFLENKQLREIYLDQNHFQILKLKPFKNSVSLKKVTLAKNPLGGCKEETLETLDYFRKKGIDTDLPNLCIEVNVSQADSVNTGSSTKLDEDSALREEIDLNVNKTLDSVNNFTFEILYRNTTLFYSLQAFAIIFLSALGLISFICIVRRHKRKNNNNTRTYLGELLIEDEESENLTPKTPDSCSKYIEITVEVDRTSKKKGHFESNVAIGAQSNCKLQPKIHKIDHIYEEIKNKLNKTNENYR